MVEARRLLIGSEYSAGVTDCENSRAAVDRETAGVRAGARTKGGKCHRNTELFCE
jgi:hypothetical protein